MKFISKRSLEAAWWLSECSTYKDIPPELETLMGIRSFSELLDSPKRTLLEKYIQFKIEEQMFKQEKELEKFAISGAILSELSISVCFNGLQDEWWIA